MADFTVRVHGLDEAMVAFTEIGGKTPVELRDKLMDIAERVAEAARGEAAMKGLFYKGAGDHGDPSTYPGELIDKIRARRGSGRVAARVTEFSSTHTEKYPSGYSYPRRFEYGQGGRRAFMRPAAELMQPVAERMASDMMDEIIDMEGF